MDYAVLDNKKHFPGMSFGNARKWDAAVNLFLVQVPIAAMGAGVALRSFQLAAGGAMVYVAGSRLHKSMRRTSEVDENYEFRHYLEEIREHASRIRLENGKATHAVFTRFGGKTYLLNREAADYLKSSGGKRVRSLEYEA